MTTPSFKLNIDEDAKCEACLNTGWVELAGTIMKWGVVYSRGSAPCKWCQEGLRRYSRMVELRQDPPSNYDWHDIIVPSDDDTPVSRSEAKRYIKQILANLEGINRP